MRELAEHYRLPFFSYMRAGAALGEPEATMWHSPESTSSPGNNHPDAYTHARVGLLAAGCYTT